MWAEDDLVAGASICLQSLIEPTQGTVYTMYHGTSIEAAENICREGFRQSPSGMFGRGVSLSRDLEKASRYPLGLDDNKKVVIKVKVNVGKVIKITRNGHPWQKTWHDHGYDTAWCPPNCGMVPSGLEEDCVWDPKRITIIDVIPSCLLYSKEPQKDRVYRMFHGTSREAAARIKREGFRQSADGMLGRGVYLSRDLEKASKYPLDLPPHQKVVLRVKVNVGKVIAINYQGHPLQKTWHDHGYDTAWCPPNCGMVKSNREEDCVWDPKRITVIDVMKVTKDDLGPSAAPCLQSLTEPSEDGVYTMYHGTSREAAAGILREGFRQSSKGMLGPGVYLSRDLKKASRYPLGKDIPAHEKVIIRVRVRVGKVKRIDSQTHPMRTTWHKNGYDTAWCPPNCGMVPSGLEEDCVWDPKRITVIDAIYPK
ncbi:grass carp reovirus (GCRV)-induced gene 2e [Misgurnus anguillicaudatus]|uniref:grass carp reovirus (GCRV)-induced gene 2e n=1 Tax=Misgurnus anguillicaudatus TaxID=75329 RepID=UPI003CCF19BD